MGSQAENASGLTCCTPYDGGQELERSHFILDSNVAKEYLKGGDGAINGEEDRLSQHQPLRRSLKLRRSWNGETRRGVRVVGSC